MFYASFSGFLPYTLAQAQVIHREALVIGNPDYSFGPLRNPRNDAEAMAKALEDAGFDVTVATDAGQDAMEHVVYALADDGSLKGLWAAGHGEETLTPEQ